MAAFDFIVLGTGSGGGPTVHQLALNFPFSTVGAIEAGADLPTAVSRRDQFLQSSADDISRGWPHFVEPTVTNYDTDPSSPYFGSGLPFVAPSGEQGMGKVVGGTSMHNGGVVGAPAQEDWDEWDYLLRNGQSRFYPAGATVTWPVIAAAPAPANTVMVANGAAVLAVAAFLDNGREVWICGSDDPKNPNGVPFKVVAYGVGTITVESNPDEGIPGTGGAVALVICTMWNRQRMGRRVYMEAVDTIDTTFVGATPQTSNPNGISALVHNSLDAPNPYVPAAVGARAPYLPQGAIGRRSNLDPAAATQWIDQRPAVTTPRQSAQSLAAMNSLVNSAAVNAAYPAIDDGAAGTTFPVLPDGTGAVSANPHPTFFEFTVLAAGPVAGNVVVGNSATGVRVTAAGPFAGATPALVAAAIAAAITAASAGAIVPVVVGATVTITRGVAVGNAYSLELQISPLAVGYNPWGRGVNVPLNMLGFNSDVSDPARPTGQPVAGGRGLQRIARYDKYDERRGTLITSIDAARPFRIVDLTLPVIGAAGEAVVGGVLTDGAASGDVLAVGVRTEVFYTANLAFLALAAGAALASGANTGTVLVAPSMVLDSALTPHVKITMSVTVGSAPFVVADVFDQVPPLLGGPGIVTNGAAGSLALSLTQQAQVSMTTAVEFDVGAAVTELPSLPAATVDSAIVQVSVISKTYADRLLTDATNLVDVIAGAPTAPVTVGDAVVGGWSGATGTVLAAGTTTGVPRADLRIQMTSGSFLQGEPISEAAAAWTATAAKLVSVRQASGVVCQQQAEDGSFVEVTYESLNVVSCLGVFNTPALLQRSGIGGADRLSPAGVEQVVDLPGVGDRAIQHSLFAGVVFYKAVPDGSDSAQYQLQLGGVYRSSQNRGGMGFEVGSNNPSGPLLFDDEYDMYYLMQATGQGFGELDPLFFSNAAANVGLAAKRQWTSNQIGAAAGAFVLSSRTYLFLALNYKPRSRGRGVFIQSTSPFDPPTCDQGLCGQWQSRDAEAILESVDQGYAKLSDAAVAPVVAPVNGAVVPPFVGTIAFPLGTPPLGLGLSAARVNTLIGSSTGAYHLAGTCAMGPDVDGLSVLDERARLRHVAGVRVADCSMYPTHMRYNPHMPTVLCAHNVAKLIQEDGGC